MTARPNPDSSNVRVVRTERFSVYPSQLRPTQSIKSALVRKRLLKLLDIASSSPVSMICAPAGYGKTTLLAQWYRSRAALSKPIAWATLDDNDDVSVRFLCKIEKAITRLTENDDSDWAVVCTPNGEDSILRSIYNRVQGHSERPVLILDNCERASSQDFSRVLLRLIEVLSEFLTIVISSRLPPHSYSGKLLSEIHPNLIDGTLLRLNREDMSLLRSAKNQSADNADVSDGWPVVTQTFIGSVQRPAGRDQSKIVLSAPLLSYIESQVLDGLPNQARRVLVELSFLDPIDLNFANQVCSSAEASRHLHRLVGLEPLISIDATNGWVQVNPLLRLVLQNQLLMMPNEEVMALHKRVVNRFARRKDTANAIEYAKRVGDPMSAVLVIDAFGPTGIIISAGTSALRQVTEKAVRFEPDDSVMLLIAKAYLAVKDGRLDASRRQLAIAERAINDDTSAANSASDRIEVEAAALRYLLSLYGNENFTREFLDRSEIEVHQSPDHDGLLGFIHALKALLYQRCASFARADTEIDMAFSFYQMADSDYGIASVHLVKGNSLFLRGRLDLARSEYAVADKLIDPAFADDPGLSATVRVYQAELRYERNELENLQSGLEAAIVSLERSDGWLDTFMAGYKIAGAIAVAKNDAERCQMYLERAMLTAAERGLDDLSRFASALEINALLKAGDVDAAAVRFREMEQSGYERANSTSKVNNYRLTDEYACVQARLDIDTGKPDAALGIVEPLIASAHRTGRMLTFTRAQVLRSTAYQSMGESEEAVDALRQATAVGCAENLARTFIDEGDSIVPILQYIVDGERRTGANTRLLRYCTRLISCFSRLEETGSGDFDFSPRERQILIQLSHGLTNKQVARKIGVTESTVKFHLKKSFAKLGVNKRGAAVVEARRRGLV